MHFQSGPSQLRVQGSSHSAQGWDETITHLRELLTLSWTHSILKVSPALSGFKITFLFLFSILGCREQRSILYPSPNFHASSTNHTNLRLIIGCPNSQPEHRFKDTNKGLNCANHSTTCGGAGMSGSCDGVFRQDKVLGITISKGLTPRTLFIPSLGEKL